MPVVEPASAETRVTGHLQVRGTGTQRKWFALYTDREGVKRTKTLGAAWVKDSGRRTPRGATVWRAASGECPPGALTPKDAEARLEDLLAQVRERPSGEVIRPAVADAYAFAELVEDWLTYLEVEKRRRPSTIRDARNTARRYLVEHFGHDRPLQSVRFVEVREYRQGRPWSEQREERTDTITVADVDALRRKLLNTDLSPRSVQKTMVLLHGLLKFGQRRGRLNVNAAADAERVALVDDEDFNVLEPVEFEAVYRAIIDRSRRPGGVKPDRIDSLNEASRQTVADFLATAFYAGPRLGELRDLTVASVDFHKSLIYVRSSFTHGARSTTKGKRVRAIPLVPQLRQRLAALLARDSFVADHDYVFTNLVGNRIDDGLARDVFYAGLERAGMGFKRDKVDRHGNAQAPMRLHDLRHSYCTWAVNVWDVTLVQKYAGHRHIQTTMRYVHRVAKTEHAEQGGAYLDAVLGAQASRAAARA